MRERVRLSSGGVFDADAVSEDSRIVARRAGQVGLRSRLTGRGLFPAILQRPRSGY